MAPEEGTISSGSRNHLKLVWSGNVDYNFNVLKVGTVFRDSLPSLIAGSEDGIVRVHKCIISDTSKQLSGIEMRPQKLETKAGPIQVMQLENLTNFKSTDVVVGDSRGMLTIFTNNQILSRRSLLENSISSISIERDSAGNIKILLGSLDGTLLAVSPYATLMKHRLPDVLNNKQQATITSLEITCIHSLRITSGSTDATFTVVADNKSFLHFFQSGTLVRTLSIPSTVLCMCSGYFTPIDSVSTPVPATPGFTAPAFGSPTRKVRPQGRAEDQIAVGTKDGRIFIVSGLNVVQYGNIGTRVTNIRAVRGSYDNCDAIVCSGNFNYLSIHQDHNEIARYRTRDWVHTFDIITRQDSSKYIFIGCLDSRIEILKFQD